MACCICRRIWEDIPVINNRPDRLKLDSGEKGTFVSAHIKVEEKHKDLYRLDFTLSGALATKSSIGTLLLQKLANNPEIWVYTPQTRRLDSDEVLSLAQSWIKTCISSHKHCPSIGFNGLQNPPQGPTTTTSSNATFYPTRLIKLGLANDLNVKLVVTRNFSHRNEDSLEKPTQQYVTLSHCWGKASNRMFCLNEKNLELFRENGIPLKELPQTFKDAIHFARRLSSKVKYIWIDSLCIIQGNKDDWLYESTQMYQVYMNSYCNISATSAMDSSQGLYVERDPQHLWEENIDLNIKGLSRVKVDSKDHAKDLKVPIQRCSIMDPSLWNRKVESAPVNTRAWVLQERLLAPRVIHFCEDQIAWECGDMEASESASSGITKFELISGAINNKVQFKSLMAPLANLNGSSNSESDHAHENWKRIIERYSTTNLTEANDKLIALSGIAEKMSTQVRAPYIAGMWRNKYFASQLLWRVKTEYKSGIFLYSSTRPRNERAPSFSWAAIDAPHGIECGETQEDRNLWITVMEVDVKPQPKPNSEFGLVSEGGFVEISCQKFAIVIERKYRKVEGIVRDDMFTWTLAAEEDGHHKNMHPSVYLDSARDDYLDICGPHSSMWLVPAYKSPQGDLICLLLQRDRDNAEKFFRRGLSTITGLRSAGNTFLGEIIGDSNVLKSRDHVIRIF
ncbi:hypothetical protein BP6252_10977 [Coleophoma cylindrospora]|uniref:Heterokaryon incompatibility domain-containing protein n=1 Tax=Coleophoma cylindrospora TaxID=1849047 RepID=A0A3D8QNQ8_9HELO|nr:hypothetical protein BP6252_10977 [Coleophoma cylindrospora]